MKILRSWIYDYPNGIEAAIEKFCTQTAPCIWTAFTNEKTVICNKCNEFFINIGPTLSKDIKPQTVTPGDFMKSRVIYSLFLEPVTESEVIKLVSSLKSSSPGYDNLSSSILKLCLPFIKTPLTYLSSQVKSKNLYCHANEIVTQ